MSQFTFKKKLTVWRLIIGTTALLVGTISLFSSFRGFIAIGVGVYLLLVEGSEFNFKTQKYREIKSILGISFGKWYPIPDIEYVSVFKTNETSTLRSRSAEANVTNAIIKLNLFYNTNQRIEAYNTYEIDDAFEKAKQLSEVLNVDILDATERESKWL